MEHLLDIKEAARVLNVSEMSIRRWTNSGKLNCFRVGGKRERRFLMSDLEEFLLDSQDHPLKPLGIGGRKVPDGSHLTHFYTGKEEALDVSLPYLLQGIKGDEALLAVMPPKKIRELLANLEEQRHPAGNWLKSGRLTVTTGMESPMEMLRYLTEFSKKTNRFRVLGDMAWTLQKGWDPAKLAGFEQSPALVSPVGNGLLLCQYSLEAFSGADIMMAAEFHRYTLYRGQLKKSPYYTQTQ